MAPPNWAASCVGVGGYPVTPFYSDGHATIYLGDCREVLPALGLSPAVVIADPPYGETALEWDRWPVGWISALPGDVRQLWCFGSMRMMLDRHPEFADWTYGQEVIWRKHNGSSLAQRRFRRVHEFAFHWYRGAWGELTLHQQYTMDATARTIRGKQQPAHWGKIESVPYTSIDGGPRQMTSVLDVRSEHGRAVHPTQKPVGLVEPLIRYSSNPGELVLDPMMGAGSTLVAAKATGRQAVGIEGREDYCEAAARRLQVVLAL